MKSLASINNKAHIQKKYQNTFKFVIATYIFKIKVTSHSDESIDFRVNQCKVMLFACLAILKQNIYNLFFILIKNN